MVVVAVPVDDDIPASSNVGRLGHVLVEDVLTQQGGVATRSEILREVTEASLRAALTQGRLVRLSRGRYALPSVDVGAPRWDEALKVTAERSRRAAHELSGTAVLLSAAARWGWRCKWVPRRPQVVVPRGRKVTATRQQRHEMHWRAIPRGDVVDGWVTDRVRTAVDCAATLPPDEALCVLDSALREGMVTRDEMLLACAGLAPRFRRRAEESIRLADGSSDNPFESVLRWIALGVPTLAVQTQVRIDDPAGFVGRVDLADEELRIVLEADSVEFHSEPEQLERDCIRYTRLVADDWLVLRFTWKQVMNDPEWVRDVIIRTVAVRRAQRALPAA